MRASGTAGGRGCYDDCRDEGREYDESELPGQVHRHGNVGAALTVTDKGATARTTLKTMRPGH